MSRYSTLNGGKNKVLSQLTVGRLDTALKNDTSIAISSSNHPLMITAYKQNTLLYVHMLLTLTRHFGPKNYLSVSWKEATLKTSRSIISDPTESTFHT